MGSIVKDITDRACPSPVVLCIFLSDAAASDGKRLAVFALNSNQLRKHIRYRRDTSLVINHGFTSPVWNKL